MNLCSLFTRAFILKPEPPNRKCSYFGDSRSGPAARALCALTLRTVTLIDPDRRTEERPGITGAERGNGSAELNRFPDKQPGLPAGLRQLRAADRATSDRRKGAALPQSPSAQVGGWFVFFCFCLYGEDATCWTQTKQDEINNNNK